MKINKVFVVNKTGEDDTAVVRALSELDIEQADSITLCDTVITVGGDGTILEAGKEAAKAGKPLLGINTGRLGFMATLEKSELHKLERLKRGEYTVSRRMLLDIQVGDKTYNAINDVVLHRESSSRLPDFMLFRESAEVIRVRGDGIIVSTATGSTAYSLSAGGPIIEPQLECFLVTALSPHTLFNRAMVFSPDKPLTVCAENVSVSVDGVSLKDDEITVSALVTKSDRYLNLIDIDGNSFYDSVHNKLMKPLK